MRRRVVMLLLLLTAAVSGGYTNEVAETPTQFTSRVERLPGNPIVVPAMLGGLDGENINGPSLIRVPPWVEGRLGEYYLYFAHHAGKYIRMAYADDLAGPWTVYGPGHPPHRRHSLQRHHGVLLRLVSARGVTRRARRSEVATNPDVLSLPGVHLRAHRQ